MQVRSCSADPKEAWQEEQWTRDAGASRGESQPAGDWLMLSERAPQLSFDDRKDCHSASRRESVKLSRNSRDWAFVAGKLLQRSRNFWHCRAMVGVSSKPFHWQMLQKLTDE